MFKISTLRRIAATAIVAGVAAAASGAPTTAMAQMKLDDIIPSPKTKPANNGLPGFEAPSRPTLTAKQVFVGTWRVQLRNGKRMAVKFMANGRFYLVNGNDTSRIEVGFWKVSQGKLVLLPVGVCDSKLQNCKKFEQRKLVHVQFRIINRNRVIAPAGVFTRHA